MASPMNIKLEKVDMDLELERVKVEMNQSENLVQQSCSQSNADPGQQFNMQAEETQIQVEDKNALNRLNFSMENNAAPPAAPLLPVPIPHTLSVPELARSTKAELLIYGGYATRKILEQHQVNQQLQQQLQQQNYQLNLQNLEQRQQQQQQQQENFQNQLNQIQQQQENFQNLQQQQMQHQQDQLNQIQQQLRPIIPSSRQQQLHQPQQGPSGYYNQGQ